MNAPVFVSVVTFQTGDAEVLIYRVNDNYQFTVVVQGEQVPGKGRLY